MSLPPDLDNIVSAYAPYRALELPFEQQRRVIREMTGYLPSSPDVVAQYLESPSLSLLTQDPAVFPLLQDRVQSEIGVLIQYPKVLAEYLDRDEGDSGFWIVARDPSTWDSLPVDDAQFLELLLQSGTRAGREEYESLTGLPLQTPEEYRLYFFGLLRNRSWNLLDDFLGPNPPGIGDYYTQDGRRLIREWSPADVALYIEYTSQGDNDHGAIRTLLDLVPTYYLEEDVDRFLYLMGLLKDDTERTWILHQFLRSIEGALDIENPVIQAYLQAYPESEASELLLQDPLGESLLVWR
jgi:hypothetical protein